MLSIPVLKSLIRPFEHRKGHPAATAILHPDADTTSDCLDRSPAACLAAYLDLDVLAVIEVSCDRKSAEITAASRTGITTSLAMPSVEDKGTLGKLVLAARPAGGRGKVFVTSEVFPRDGNWCDFLPLDSGAAFFFVPIETLPVGERRCGTASNLFILAADLGKAEPDCHLELKTYLAASLVLLSGEHCPSASLLEAVRPYERFLETQGYSLCVTDDRGNPISFSGRAFHDGGSRVLAATRDAVRTLQRGSPGEAEPTVIELGLAEDLRATAYPTVAPAGRPGYLVLLGARPGQQPSDLRKDWLKLLGRFTSSIAHEIKNPLTGIAAGVQYLAKRLQPGAAEAETVDFILAEITRLNRIVDDLYRIARPPELVLKSTCINDVVAKSIFCLSEEIVRKRLRLEQRIDKAIPAFQGDPERLQQVVINVMKNAIEASREGGQIEVSTGSSGGSLSVRVKDSGPGVPEAEKERIFEPFFSTKKGGTGLGLCISQAIVSEHGGKMWLEAPSEGGAVFVIDIPVERGHGENTDCR